MALKKKSKQITPEPIQEGEEYSPARIEEFKKAYHITKKKLYKACDKLANLQEDIHSMELSLDYFKNELLEMGIDIEEDED
jgi:septal ring factor EnvC (AmiA/AmiB activator)